MKTCGLGKASAMSPLRVDLNQETSPLQVLPIALCLNPPRQWHLKVKDVETDQEGP